MVRRFRQITSVFKPLIGHFLVMICLRGGKRQLKAISPASSHNDCVISLLKLNPNNLSDQEPVSGCFYLNEYWVHQLACSVTQTVFNDCQTEQTQPRAVTASAVQSLRLVTAPLSR